MEKFTAEQARTLMPDRFKEMVERIHADIREAALAGKTEVVITFRKEFNGNSSARKVKDFLEKDEGYSVFLSVSELKPDLSFYISWREL